MYPYCSWWERYSLCVPTCIIEYLVLVNVLWKWAKIRKYVCDLIQVMGIQVPSGFKWRLVDAFTRRNIESITTCCWSIAEVNSKWDQFELET